eukprot:GEZU01019309.1.p1 GENE.GEZU01019309.1~~GEZU01019309.1.p1  ORF type:complete len:222 (-),score=61.62 GEZU01019309.1:452-1117(-)
MNTAQLISNSAFSNAQQRGGGGGAGSSTTTDPVLFVRKMYAEAAKSFENKVADKLSDVAQNAKSIRELEDRLYLLQGQAAPRRNDDGETDDENKLTFTLNDSKAFDSLPNAKKAYESMITFYLEVLEKLDNDIKEQKKTMKTLNSRVIGMRNRVGVYKGLLAQGISLPEVQEREALVPKFVNKPDPNNNNNNNSHNESKQAFMQRQIQEEGFVEVDNAELN